MSTHLPTGATRRATLAAAALVLAAACGRSQNQSADSTAPADSTAYAPPVGSNKPAMDSNFARADSQLDSANKTPPAPGGVSPTIRSAGAASNNDNTADTNRLRARPANRP